MEELDGEVEKWCEELLALSPTALKVLKKTFDTEFATMRAEMDARNFLHEINPDFYESGEQKEGTSAFLEKRPADYSPWR